MKSKISVARKLKPVSMNDGSMYTNFYNLKESPFNLTPDPKFLYLSQPHKEALVPLVYGVRKRKGFMVMTGEVGTGKTTLIHALLRILGEDTKTVFIFNPILDVKDFFKFVCVDLGIPVANRTKGDHLLQIYQFLVESYRSNRNVVLIIDEAHTLNNFLLEEIRLISNFETAKDKLIQIILVGQPELTAILNQPQCRPLKQRINFWVFLNPLNQKETDEYITLRLRRAGMETSCYTAKATEEIYRYTKGIPRLINILCDNCLTVGYTLDKKKIDEKILRETIAMLEAPGQQSGESSEAAQSPDRTEQSHPKEKPKILRAARPLPRKRKKWGLFFVVLWAALFLSGILFWNFGIWSNKNQGFKRVSTEKIRMPIPGVGPSSSQTASAPPQQQTGNDAF
jgi:general secretion pathway protein A